MPVEENLQSMGYVLPAVAKPVASYVPAVRTGNLIFVSGQVPTESGQMKWHGQVGADLSEDDAYDAARTAALNALAALKSVAGDLDNVRRIVRVTGYVSSDPGFTNQSVVVDGASDFLVKLFGDRGQHARVAIGVAALPLDAPVEIELIAEVG